MRVQGCNSLKFLWLILLVFPFINGYAQRDTVIVYDTVYEVREPVVITKQVVVEEPPAEQKASLWLLQIMGNYNHYSSPKSNLKHGSGLSVGFKAGRTLLSGLYVSLGAGMTKWDEQYTNTHISSQHIEKEVPLEDTLGYHIHYYQGKNDTVYITETRVEKVTEERSDTIQNSYRQKTTYLTLPIEVSYRLSWKRFEVAPHLGLVCLIAVNNPVGRESSLKFNNHIFEGRFGVSVTRELIKEISFVVDYSYSVSLNSLLPDKTLRRNSHSMGLGLRYSF